MALQVRQIGQGLDIAHHRGSLFDADFEWAGRLVCRLDWTAVDHANGGGLLTGHVPGLHRQAPDRRRRRGCRARARCSAASTLCADSGSDAQCRRGQRPRSSRPAAVRSRTRWGRFRSSHRSLIEVGSPSSPFATTTAPWRQAPVVAHRPQFHRHGKAAPPRPTSPLDSTALSNPSRGAGKRPVAAKLSIRGEILAPAAGLFAQQPRLTPGCHGGGDGGRLSGVQS